MSTINTEIDSLWCLYHSQLSRALSQKITDGNLLRYVDLCATIALTTDPTVRQYLNSKELDTLRDSLIVERDSLRQLLGSTKSLSFERFDKLYAMMTA